ncbi:hypothetical protein C8J57DRAFT_1574538 [Mycena rebaudengoi]|nr:hypothetical protein C8J57DRAFT_1574538 [Mycena rebaudengoi]
MSLASRRRRAPAAAINDKTEKAHIPSRVRAPTQRRRSWCRTVTNAQRKRHDAANASRGQGGESRERVAEPYGRLCDERQSGEGLHPITQRGAWARQYGTPIASAAGHYYPHAGNARRLGQCSGTKTPLALAAAWYSVESVKASEGEPGYLCCETRPATAHASAARQCMKTRRDGRQGSSSLRNSMCDEQGAGKLRVPPAVLDAGMTVERDAAEVSLHGDITGREGLQLHASATDAVRDGVESVKEAARLGGRLRYEAGQTLSRRGLHIAGCEKRLDRPTLERRLAHRSAATSATKSRNVNPDKIPESGKGKNMITNKFGTGAPVEVRKTLQCPQLCKKKKPGTCRA